MEKYRAEAARNFAIRSIVRLGKQGVDMTKFKAMFSSFAIASKATRATKLQDAYQLDGVPALGVAGQFLTNGTLTGSMPKMLQVANALIAKAPRA